MKFYINEVQTKDSDWNHRCIGLFTNNEWNGAGNFCGWYAIEYYTNTTLLAYGIQNRSGGWTYNSLYPFDKIEYKNEYYNEIPIGSVIWEESFEAKDIDEALEIFSQQKWRD